MLLLLLSLVVWASAAPPPPSCSWNTCNEWSSDPNIINVHIVPHTHDDLGWIKTVDQYFFGSKPELVPVGVQYIYNTVIDEVAKDPARRFSFAETGFLTRWTSTHTDAERHKLQKLVKTGQIEMIGGGWVQHDEAAAHYVDIIDQMELGLHHLDRLFGECGHAQTAWQIDPFGHSRETANLFALMGYSSLFFARVHYLEKAARLTNKSLEFVWNASDDLKTKILTGAFYQDNYGPPEGFCFDALCGDDPIIEHQDMEGYNLPEKLQLFEAHVKKQASFLRTKHVMLLMGSDFQYTNANAWYTNLDKLIQHVNANSSLGLRLFYSTPTCYVKGLNEASPQLTTKDDDFFPYASSNHSFWTGYFTSRPAFKGMIREASSLLQLVRQLNVFAAEGIDNDHEVERMQRASALAQHHDAVTGTAKENVTRDYERRLAAGMKDGQAILHDALAHLSTKSGVNVSLPQQIRCELRNETVCEPIRNVAAFTVTVFNPRGHTMKETIRIPYFSRNVVVLNRKKQPVESEITKTFQNQVQSVQPRAPFELSFPVKVSPLGFATYFVNNATSNRATRVTHPIKTTFINDEDMFIENKLIRVDFDKSGLVASVLDKASNVSYPLKQEFLYYEGYDIKNEQTSGAYGPLTQEARQIFSPWISQVVRLADNSKDVEFTWTVGPLPIETNITKDFITRYTFGVKSGSTFYTDSNGRQMMKRTRDAHPSFAYENTEPIAANYYPITTAVLIRDDSTQATVLTDRSQGASSPADGVIDVMVHRRSFYDDHWGVEEPLNEPVTVAAFDGNVDEYVRNFETEFAGLKSELPPHAHLLTLAKWEGKRIILRLEHVFQISEDDTVTTPVSVDLRTLFSTINVTAKREVLLSGIREPATERKDYADDFLISLHPMEIRTFILDTE
ncbi:aman-1 [Pristionchus pacificus]|uniref:Alpha-mannosidase n=1 Tax=Pristionchus pacificus TaxID=54126 RepID=A0A2A6C5X1_PRIPA|nr:aman-1 [Pristionchus pacificus]|eukprot:PDM73488.1 aman-1 [Pristionchus pacificus]